jgi:hypothetical protein
MDLHISEPAIPRHKFRQHHSPPKTTKKPKTAHKSKKKKRKDPAEAFVKALAKTRYEYDF